MSTTKSNVKEKPQFHAGMTVGEAMRLHEDAELVFKSYNLAGCAQCSINSMETIEQVCNAYGVPMDLLLDSLNNLMD